ncbi:hypothetical protein NC652_039529 [Populus alba x Populus x berolinensis]|nr:hypothetical protein NC652_039529 [Populus alba x Populus x berolinensis]
MVLSKVGSRNGDGHVSSNSGNLHRHELEDGKAHIGCQEFNICFFLNVHSIEGLPPSFNGINLSVHWKTKDVVFRTRAAKVLKGMDEFDETLMHKCSIYGVDKGKQWVDACDTIIATESGGTGEGEKYWNWHNSEELDTLSDHRQQLKPTFHSEFEFDIDDRGDEYDNIKFSVAEQGIEMSEMEQMESEQDVIQTSDGSAIETINVDEIIKDADIALDEET